MIVIRNWRTFQHFRDRQPIWIKLYRELLHKREWRRLSGDASKLLVDLWMMAAERNDNGTISGTPEDVAYDLRTTNMRLLHASLQELVVSGFIELISDEYQGDVLEKRREYTEEKSIVLSGADAFPIKPKQVGRNYEYPPEFEQAWSAYPEREGGNPKVGAYGAWRARATGGADTADLTKAAGHYRDYVRAAGKEGSPFVQQASTFYGPTEPWRDYLQPVKPGPNGNGHASPGRVDWTEKNDPRTLTPSRIAKLNQELGAGNW